MIDVKVLRENPDLVRASQKARGEDVTLVDKALAADELRRNAIVEFEALRAEQNTLSKSVGAAKGDEKAALLEKAKGLSSAVKEAEAKKNSTEADFKSVAMEISISSTPPRPLVAKQISLSLKKLERHESSTSNLKIMSNSEKYWERLIPNAAPKFLAHVSITSPASVHSLN